MTHKSVMRIAFAVLAGAVCLTAAPLSPGQDAKPFIGDWKGSISVMGQELEILCHFTLDDAGAIQGTFDSPLQGAYGMALGDIKIEGKKIAFIIVGVPGDPTFSGELDEGGAKLAGDFSQGGATGTFSLEKEKKE